jgi:RND family efflux transporter MFP subunit
MNKVILIFFSLIITASCSKKEEKSEEIIRPIKFGKIVKSAGDDSYTFSGTAQANNETNLSFRVSGTLRTVQVKLGDRVKKGQIIATIDPSDYNISLDQAIAKEKGAEAGLISAETQIKSAESQLIASKSNYQRIENLYENNSVPLSEYEQAKANFEAASSQYEATKAQYEASSTEVTASEKQKESARNQVNYTRLEAPFDGVISEVNVEENETVASGNPVAIISTEAEPQVNLGVPEVFINKIFKGQEVKIQFSVLSGKSFNGIVDEVSFAAGSSPTYPVNVRIIKPSDEIRPGMAANVTFDFSSKKSKSVERLIAPVKAVGEGNDGNFVFVLEANNDGIYIAKKRNIKIGDLLSTGFEITDGLEEGELVATAGLKSLLDGMKIKLIDN